jgi:hypothetical protein
MYSYIVQADSATGPTRTIRSNLNPNDFGPFALSNGLWFGAVWIPPHRIFSIKYGSEVINRGDF